MGVNAVTVRRVLPWPAILVVLLTSSAGAQTVQPGVGLNLTSDSPTTTQQPLAGGGVERIPTERGRRWGYAFGGVGLLSNERVNAAVGFVVNRAVDRTQHFGGGMEWQLSPSIGIAAEGSIYVVPEVAVLAFSVNGSYRFRSAPPGQPSFVPFVTGGLSLPGPFSPGINIGAGADYWLRERDGLRFEVRLTRGRDARDVGLDDGRQIHFVDYPWLVDFRIGINFGRSRGTASRR